jgi:hypothetical protein
LRATAGGALEKMPGRQADRCFHQSAPGRKNHRATRDSEAAKRGQENNAEEDSEQKNLGRRFPGALGENESRDETNRDEKTGDSEKRGH